MRRNAIAVVAIALLSPLLGFALAAYSQSIRSVQTTETVRVEVLPKVVAVANWGSGSDLLVFMEDGSVYRSVYGSHFKQWERYANIFDPTEK